MIGLFMFVCLLQLSPEIESKLTAQRFVIVPTREDEIYDIYKSCKESNQPILVTQDIILHTTHILFDYTLRILELETLLPKLETLTRGMLEASKAQVADAKNATVKKAALRNIVFFGVAAELLSLEISDDIPKNIRSEIELELGLIESHQGFKASPAFGYFEDYSQYIPRGHYTRNKDFERYFKAMMWYGRIGFYLKPDPSMYSRSVDPVQEGIKLTRQAILMAKIIDKSEELARLWNEIYKPTTFFVGKSEDLTLYDYQLLIKELDLSSDEIILSFIEKVKSLPKPQILGTSVISFGEPVDTLGIMGFRFMGQRFIPDSYIFQNLVFPKIGKYLGKGQPFTLEMTQLGPMRCFPRGLDVMSVFGSEAAADILKDEGDTDFANYAEQIEKLSQQFAAFPLTQWEENLYWRWLYALKLLVTHTHEKFPQFMQSKYWVLKELNAALSSWAELRHDTILYAKQSYTAVGTGMPPPPKLTHGFVEPYPEIYRWIAELIEELCRTSEYPEEVESNLAGFSRLLNQLSEISEKELKNEELSVSDYELIWDIGYILEGVITFSDDLMEKITSGIDNKMAVIADVHTDANSSKVLEEGVGYPFIIYARLNEGKVVKGGVFSYYEFKQPMAERLTDEKWQEMLTETPPPEMQQWFVPLIK